MKSSRLLLLALLPFSCAPTRSQPSAASEVAPPRVPSAEPHLVARIADERLGELSGLAASRRFAGWAWAHNDSGDTARLFLLDAQGRTRAVVNIANAQAVDWEDIAVAGGRGDSTVTIADSGDNLRARDGITLYRFRERDLPLQTLERPGAPLEPIEISITVRSLPLRYPEADGAQNCEALAANARGDLLLVTKSVGPSRLYLARWPQGATAGAQTLRLVGEKQFGSTAPGKRRVREMQVTGADLSPDESRLALVTYAELWVWKLPRGDWSTLDWKSVLQSAAIVKPLPQMQQCESVAWMGASQVLVSSEGHNPPLWSIPTAAK